MADLDLVAELAKLRADLALHVRMYEKARADATIHYMRAEADTLCAAEATKRLAAEVFDPSAASLAYDDPDDPFTWEPDATDGTWTRIDGAPSEDEVPVRLTARCSSHYSDIEDGKRWGWDLVGDDAGDEIDLGDGMDGTADYALDAMQAAEEALATYRKTRAATKGGAS